MSIHVNINSIWYCMYICVLQALWGSILLALTNICYQHDFVHCKCKVWRVNNNFLPLSLQRVMPLDYPTKQIPLVTKGKKKKWNDMNGSDVMTPGLPEKSKHIMLRVCCMAPHNASPVMWQRHVDQTVKRWTRNLATLSDIFWFCWNWMRYVNFEHGFQPLFFTKIPSVSSWKAHMCHVKPMCTRSYLSTSNQLTTPIS